MNQIMTYLAIFFDPTPDTAFVLQNHFIYLYLILLIISIILIVKKSAYKRIASILRVYSIIGLFIIGLRYENAVFLSMRAIFVFFNLIFIYHLTKAYFSIKKELHVRQIMVEKKHISNPYLPAPKKHKAKRNRKR